MLSARGVHQHPCLPKHSPNLAESGLEGHAKGRELGTLGQEPVRFVKVTHRLVIAGLTRKFETSPVGGPTCRKTPISLSALGQRWRSSVESAKTRPGADCGSDHDAGKD